jgi:hypothetical protein
MNIKSKNLKKLGEGMILFAFICAMGFASCTWDEIPPPPKVEIPDTVTLSFTDDIVPIFEANCNAGNCHGGFWAPDLRPSVAYNELTTGGYIDVDTPEDSELYIKISPGQSMAQYVTAEERALILEWINQGAEDN